MQIKIALPTGERLHATDTMATWPAMKASDADILIIPGYTNSGPDHWQTRWQSRLSTARRVEQEAWSKPVREDWVANVAKAVNEAEKPVVLVAHSLGVATAVQAIPEFRKPVAGAFFVAPPDVANSRIRPKHLMRQHLS